MNTHTYISLAASTCSIMTSKREYMRMRMMDDEDGDDRE